jgi:hypothetical protein
MKGNLSSFIRGGLLAHVLLLCHGMAIAYGTSSATLEVSTVILPEPPPVVVQTLNAKKEVIAVYQMHPSNAMENAYVISTMEEAKGDAGKIKIISVTFN